MIVALAGGVIDYVLNGLVCQNIIHAGAEQTGGFSQFWQRPHGLDAVNICGGERNMKVVVFYELVTADAHLKMIVSVPRMFRCLMAEVVRLRG